jgi:tripartite-type tricarboxylate transporter receptor subunit TctC
MQRRTLGALLGMLALAERAGAQTMEFPQRPIRMIVPLAPGQGSDILARRVGEYLRPILRQPVVVENRAGAGGNLGAAAAARADADGYTLLWGNNATNGANEFLFASMPFDPQRDFVPVAAVARFGMVLTANAASPWRTLEDALAAARAKPGEVSVGVPSTTARAVLQMLRRATGTDLTPVPYTGTGQAQTGLLRGDVQLMIDTVAASGGPIAQGTMRGLAVSLGSRAGALPQVPSMVEQGVAVEAQAWNAVFAPRGTPAEAIRVLNRAVNTALADAELRAALVRDGAEPMGGTPEELGALTLRDRALWGEVIRSLGLTPQ